MVGIVPFQDLQHQHNLPAKVIWQHIQLKHLLTYHFGLSTLGLPDSPEVWGVIEMHHKLLRAAKPAAIHLHFSLIQQQKCTGHHKDYISIKFFLRHYGEDEDTLLTMLWECPPVKHLWKEVDTFGALAIKLWSSTTR